MIVRVLRMRAHLRLGLLTVNHSSSSCCFDAADDEGVFAARFFAQEEEEEVAAAAAAFGVVKAFAKAGAVAAGVWTFVVVTLALEVPLAA